MSGKGKKTVDEDIDREGYFGVILLVLPLRIFFPVLSASVDPCTSSLLSLLSRQIPVLLSVLFHRSILQHVM